jgi:hypothetical protein
LTLGPELAISEKKKKRNRRRIETSTKTQGINNKEAVINTHFSNRKCRVKFLKKQNLMNRFWIRLWKGNKLILPWGCITKKGPT